MAETNRTDLPLTGSRLLARNTLFNLAGHGIPLLVALFSIPVIIRGLGTERYGVLTVAWMIVGYFSIFDLGIGRATTKFVAENLARGETETLPELIWSSLGMLVGFGLCGSLLLAALTPLIAPRFLQIPPYLAGETLNAFYLIAASIPLVLGTSGTRGILEAHKRFDVINAIKVPVSTTFYVAPLLVLPFSNSLTHVTAVLLATRLTEFAAYLLFCWRSIPGMNSPRLPKLADSRRLLAFGGWLTVTNVVGPLMTYMDRFILGGILSMSAVTFYATPYDFVARLAIVPASLLCAVFPDMNSLFIVDRGRFALLYEKAVKYVFVVMTPVVLMLTAAAEPFLNMWLGREFAVQSTLVLQILSIGMLVNSVGQVPYSAIQAMGRPDMTAKVHLMELPLYLGMIWFFTTRMGIVGAAVAWSVRALIDAVLLGLLAHRMMPPRVAHGGVHSLERSRP